MPNRGEGAAPKKRKEHFLHDSARFSSFALQCRGHTMAAMIPCAKISFLLGHLLSTYKCKYNDGCPIRMGL
jgi:hypothetical protein